MNARSVESFATKHAAAVRGREWHHHDLADLQVADRGSDILDDPDRLVAHRLTRL